MVEWLEAPVCGCLVGYQVQFPTAVACVCPLCVICTGLNHWFGDLFKKNKTLAAEVMIANIQLLYRIYQNKRNFEWATAWRVAPKRLRDKAVMSKPKSNSKTFDNFWPGPVII